MPSDIEMHSNSTRMKFYRSRSFSYLSQRPLVRHLSTFLEDFSSETVGLIALESHVQPHDKGEKLYIFGLGHMTKMSAMLIYGKNVKKSPTPVPLS